MDREKIKELATSLANSVGADVILYNGALDRPCDSHFIDLCRKANRRTNAFLFLCTNGGEANVAYRIARCLQKKYDKLTIFICGSCKSAGTLLAVGAHEIVMSDHGEIGPLDVQVGKKDELWETDSGLTVLSAIETLEERAFSLFETGFLDLKMRSRGRITLKTATELAGTLAIGVVSPIVAQIDPMHVGEVSRAMKIGLEYGARLADHSKNPNENTLDMLTNRYPSHAFVIDRQEAQSLFNNVREPNESEIALIEQLGFMVREPNTESPFIAYISEPCGESTNESNNEENLGTGSSAESERVERDEKAIKSAEGICTEPNEAQISHLGEKLKGAAQS